MLADPARKLHCSNVITLPVMGAAFTDENFVTIFQLVQHLCAFDLKLQIPFVSGKQDGKRGQWNIFRCIGRYFGKRLAVGDDKAWLFAKRRKCFLQFCVTGYNRDCTSLQYIADGLLLRERQNHLDLKDRGRDIYPDLLPEPGLQSVLLIHEHGIRLLC